MRKTYRLATVQPYRLVPFGPLMTRAQAESYRADLIAGGFAVVVVNTESM